MTYEEHAEKFVQYKALESAGDTVNARKALKEALNITLEEVDKEMGVVIELPSINSTLKSLGVADALMGTAFDYLRTYRDTQAIKHTRKTIYKVVDSNNQPSANRMFPHAIN